MGRELDVLISYQINNETHTLTNEELSNVCPYYEGNILKSVMKELEFNSSVDIPMDTIINLKIAIKVNDEYEYLNYGNYTVYVSEKQEDTNTFKISCYDKMLNSMKEYLSPDIEYPISIRNYIKAICQKIGLQFANENDTFANYDKLIPSELYLSNGESLGYTFRDVLDELAQVTASTICLNENDELEIRYINDTNDTIDEEFFNDTNVTFKEKYGPVNSVVLSRSAESDNIYLKDDESISENGLCEIKIIDNQIMNWNNRNEFLPAIFSRLNGLEYYLNDFSSKGILYYDLCDKYNIQIGNNIYSCVMLNNEVILDDGLEENIFTDKLNESVTDYSKADKQDIKNTQTWFIINKQKQEMEMLISSNTNVLNQVSDLKIELGKIQTLVSESADITKTAENVGTVTLDNINASEPVRLVIHPVSEDISYLYLEQDMYLEENMYLLSRDIVFENENNFSKRYTIPCDLLIKDGVYDEFILDYNTHKCVVKKRVEINANGEKYILSAETVQEYDYPKIELEDGNYTVRLLSFNTGYISCTLMTKNVYTEQFYTKVEANSAITQTREEINLSVNEKLSNYSTTVQMNSAINQKANEINLTVSKKVGKSEIISSINQSSEKITIDANKLGLSANNVIDIISGNEINLSSKNISIKSTNFSVTKDGALTSKSGTIGGWLISADRISQTRAVSDGKEYKVTLANYNNDNSDSRVFHCSIDGTDTFSIKRNGKMFCLDAEITGKITSDDGKIGGWNISENGFSNGNVFIDKSGASTIYTVADLIIIREYLLDNSSFKLSSAMLKHYDFDGDGKVTASDYVKLQNIIGIKM